MCIYYQYAILLSYINRNAKPKMVICEVMPEDVEQTNGPTFNLEAALDRLAPHYGEIPAIDSLFRLNGWKEIIKLKSKSYRYNSKLVQTIKCNYIPSYEDNGYEALTGELPIERNDTTSVEIPRPANIDSLKLSYVSKLINLCNANDIYLVFCYSPLYYKSESVGIRTIKELADKSSIPFIDYSQSHQFRSNKLYQDAMHLNNIGAQYYTSAIAHDIKKKF
jgi:hypothetical protein